MDNKNADQVVVNDLKGVADPTILKEGVAYTAEYFHQPKPGLLSLRSNRTLHFDCQADHTKDLTINLDDIKLANFAFAGSGSVVFTMKDGQKHNFTFADFTGGALANATAQLTRQIDPASAVGGLAKVGALVNDAAIIGTAVHNTDDWQQMLVNYLRPEQIKLGSSKRYALYVGITIFIMLIFTVLLTLFMANATKK